jgi:hypothetical protein
MIDSDNVPNWLKFNGAKTNAHYSEERANENAELLRTLLGDKWLRRGSQSQRRFHHLILNAWSCADIHAFVQMNSLAEDLRVLSETDSLDVMLCDLRQERQCAAAWHVVHAAALFARDPGQTVLAFFPKSQLLVPDFTVRVASGDTLAVEAKLLMVSKSELEFGRYAKGLLDLAFNTLLLSDRMNPFVRIIIKDSTQRAPVADVLAALAAALEQYRSNHIEWRALTFNIFISPTPIEALPFAAYRACMVLAPRSPAEDIRVFDRSKEATKQLKAFNNGCNAGVFCLGLTKHQDPHFLAKRFEERFKGGNYSNISSAILMARMEPIQQDVKPPLDFATVVYNPKAKVHLPTFYLHTAGHFADLKPEPPTSAEVSAYQCSAVEAKRGQLLRDATLRMPGIEHLTAEQLR